MKPVENLKSHVCGLAHNPEFIHSDWFVEHHLLIIEQIVNELCEKYPEADALVVKSMVWVHDWGKIVTNKGADEKEATKSQVLDLLSQFGYHSETIGKILHVYEEMENVAARQDVSLEAKIISSADGLAHYVGPFMSAYWRENAGKPLDVLIADNIRKVEKDKLKILLPEVMAIAEPRMRLVLEHHPRHRPQRYF